MYESFSSLLRKATLAFSSLSKEEQDAHMKRQRDSWTRGEDALDRVNRLQTLVDNHQGQTQEDVEYILASLQGKLRRISYLLSGMKIGTAPKWLVTAKDTSIEAEKLGNALRSAIEQQRATKNE